MAQIPAQQSPAINVSEIDLTNIVPAVSTTAGAFAGLFRWGPAKTVTVVNNEKDLVANFGTPSASDTSQAQDFFCAANFLQYATQLRMVRVVGTADMNARNDGGTQSQINNSVEFNAGSAYWNGSGAKVYARYPGDLGNSLRVVVYDSNGTDSITLGATASVGANVLTFTGLTGEVGDKIVFGSTGSYQQLTIMGWSGANQVTISPLINTAIGVSAAAAIKSRWTTYFSHDPSTSTDAAASNGSNDELNIIVIDRLGNFTGTPNSVLERFESISKAYDAKTVDGGSNYYFDIINSQSTYIYVDQTKFGGSGGGSGVEDKATTFGDIVSTGGQGNVRTKMASFILSGATSSNNAYDYAYVNGYSYFEDVDAQDVSLVISGRAAATLSLQINDLVNTRRDCVAFFSPLLADILNIRADIAASNIVNYRLSSLNINSSYCIMDSGWKYAYDRYNDRFLWVPINPDIAGLCARTDSIFDPWFSPAGFSRGIIKGVVKLAFDPNSSALRDTLYPNGINPVATFPGEGTILFGDKTMQTKASAFDRINVRRMFIVLEKAIARAARFQLFEQNDEFTRSQFRNIVSPFLRDVQGRRGIMDFRVVCDETNNTAQVIDNNQFVADIYIKPARSINFIQLNFVATRTDASFQTIGG